MWDTIEKCAAFDLLAGNLPPIMSRSHVASEYMAPEAASCIPPLYIYCGGDKSLIQLDDWQAVDAENGGDFAAVMDVMFEHPPDDLLA